MRISRNKANKIELLWRRRMETTGRLSLASKSSALLPNSKMISFNFWKFKFGQNSCLMRESISWRLSRLTVKILADWQLMYGEHLSIVFARISFFTVTFFTTNGWNLSILTANFLAVLQLKVNPTGTLLNAPELPNNTCWVTSFLSKIRNQWVIL